MSITTPRGASFENRRFQGVIGIQLFHFTIQNFGNQCKIVPIFQVQSHLASWNLSFWASRVLVQGCSILGRRKYYSALRHAARWGRHLHLPHGLGRRSVDTSYCIRTYLRSSKKSSSWSRGPEWGRAKTSAALLAKTLLIYGLSFLSKSHFLLAFFLNELSFFFAIHNIQDSLYVTLHRFQLFALT